MPMTGFETRVYHQKLKENKSETPWLSHHIKLSDPGRQNFINSVLSARLENRLLKAVFHSPGKDDF